MMDTQMNSVDIGRLRMAYFRWGHGPHIVVALHGFPDTPLSMAPIAERLPADQYTLIAPFLPGYGPTLPPRWTIRYRVAD